MNHGGGGSNIGNSKTIDDLDDNMLIQILFRLPSCAPIVACKVVNKRWCSLISDPKFGSHYSYHKTESTAVSKLLGHNTVDDEPPFTFTAIMRDIQIPRHQYCGDEAITNKAVFGFPKLSLKFLPCYFRIEATFMDLVLCSNILIRNGCRIYYITNPVTKQWVALPPCPRITDNECRLDRWVGLVCQQPYDDFTQNYKFRVVVINHCRPPIYELRVYCSEICEWKKFNLSVSINNPELAAQKRLYNTQFKGVVCNGIIYLHHRLYFAAFNPFDVEETTDTRKIEAKVLPSLSAPVGCFLRESSGQLYIMHNPNKDDYDSVYYRQRGEAIEFPLVVWKLDPNQVPLIWKKTFEGLCTGNLNKYEPPISEVVFPIREVFFRGLGMHPSNDNLIYMHLYSDEQLVLCDTRTRLIKPLQSLATINAGTFDRLEIQWWPTSVPKAYLSNASQ